MIAILTVFYENNLLKKEQILQNGMNEVLRMSRDFYYHVMMSHGIILIFVLFFQHTLFGFQVEI